MRAIGKGRADLAAFTGMMSTVTDVSYSIHNSKLCEATTAEKEANMSAA